MLLNYHIGRLVLSSLCVGDLVRLVLSGARFAGCASACKTLHESVVQPRVRELGPRGPKYLLIGKGGSLPLNFFPNLNSYAIIANKNRILLTNPNHFWSF